MRKNKEMQDSLKKFREETQKLEQSEALRTARQKFQAVESEATKGSEVIKEKLDTIKEKVCGSFTYTKRAYSNSIIYDLVSFTMKDARSYRRGKQN